MSEQGGWREEEEKRPRLRSFLQSSSGKYIDSDLHSWHPWLGMIHETGSVVVWNYLDKMVVLRWNVAESEQQTNTKTGSLKFIRFSKRSLRQTEVVGSLWMERAGSDNPSKVGGRERSETITLSPAQQSRECFYLVILAEHRIIVFNLKTFKSDDLPLSLTEGRTQNCLEFVPGRLHVALGGGDGVIRIVDISTFRLVTRLSGGHKVAISRLFYGNDKLTSGGTDGHLCVWDLSSQKVLWTNKTHPSEITGLYFHPISNQSVSISSDRCLLVWKPQGDQKSRIKTKVPVTSVSPFHHPYVPRGSLLSCAKDDPRIYLLNTVTEEFTEFCNIGTLYAPLLKKIKLLSITVHPDRPNLIFILTKTHALVLDYAASQTPCFASNYGVNNPKKKFFSVSYPSGKAVRSGVFSYQTPNHSHTSFSHASKSGKGPVRFGQSSNGKYFSIFWPETKFVSICRAPNESLPFEVLFSTSAQSIAWNSRSCMFAIITQVKGEKSSKSDPSKKSKIWRRSLHTHKSSNQGASPLNNWCICIRRITDEEVLEVVHQNIVPRLDIYVANHTLFGGPLLGIPVHSDFEKKESLLEESSSGISAAPLLLSSPSPGADLLDHKPDRHRSPPMKASMSPAPPGLLPPPSLTSDLSLSPMQSSPNIKNANDPSSPPESPSIKLASGAQSLTETTSAPFSPQTKSSPPQNSRSQSPPARSRSPEPQTLLPPTKSVSLPSAAPAKLISRATNSPKMRLKRENSMTPPPHTRSESTLITPTTSPVSFSPLSSSPEYSAIAFICWESGLLYTIEQIGCPEHLFWDTTKEQYLLTTTRSSCTLYSLSSPIPHRLESHLSLRRFLTPQESLPIRLTDVFWYNQTIFYVTPIEVGFFSPRSLSFGRIVLAHGGAPPVTHHQIDPLEQDPSWNLYRQATTEGDVPEYRSRSLLNIHAQRPAGALRFLGLSEDSIRLVDGSLSVVSLPLRHPAIKAYLLASCRCFSTSLLWALNGLPPHLFPDFAWFLNLQGYVCIQTPLWIQLPLETKLKILFSRKEYEKAIETLSGAIFKFHEDALNLFHQSRVFDTTEALRLISICGYLSGDGISFPEEQYQEKLLRLGVLLDLSFLETLFLFYVETSQQHRIAQICDAFISAWQRFATHYGRYKEEEKKKRGKEERDQKKKWDSTIETMVPLWSLGNESILFKMKKDNCLFLDEKRKLK